MKTKFRLGAIVVAVLAVFGVLGLQAKEAHASSFDYDLAVVVWLDTSEFQQVSCDNGIGTQRLDKLLDGISSIEVTVNSSSTPTNLGSDDEARLDIRISDSVTNDVTTGTQRLDKLLTNGDAPRVSNSPFAGMQLTQPNAFNESTTSIGPPAAITAAAAPITSASSRGTTQDLLDPSPSTPLAAPRTGQGPADAFAILPPAPVAVDQRQLASDTVSGGAPTGDAKEVTSSGSSASIVTNVPDSGEAGLAPNSVWPLALPIASLLVIIVASAAAVSVARR